MKAPRRVGLLIPSSNIVMERDLHLGLAGVATVHTARMFMTETTPAAEQVMLDEEASPAARRLATIEPDVVVFGCTSASSLHDNEYDEKFREGLAEIVHAPVHGVLDSVFDELKGQRVAVLTPYVEQLTASVAASLVAGGIEVVTTMSGGIETNLDIARLTPDDVVAMASRMDLDGAETLFCSCTNLRAMDARPELERRTGLRVTTSNSAVVRRLAAREELP